MTNLCIHQKNLSKILENGFWRRKDVPQNEWKYISKFATKEKTFGILISGSFEEPRRAHNKEGIIAGFDWIRVEENPRQGEPELNVDHFVVGQPDNDGYCPIYGPYRTDAHLPHWCTLEEIPRIKLGGDI